ncbi:septum formation family protein [Mycetocola saprophilus]|uniref:septum formation family protein n=1 Tax=Mycetocola saprophilus TaxID=76636 RepID=UPI0004C1DD4E|nr:septum formation family protein [Mycetocola saprophilus]
MAGDNGRTPEDHDSEPLHIPAHEGEGEATPAIPAASGDPLSPTDSDSEPDSGPLGTEWLMAALANTDTIELSSIYEALGEEPPAEPEVADTAESVYEALVHEPGEVVPPTEVISVVPPTEAIPVVSDAEANPAVPDPTVVPAAEATPVLPEPEAIPLADEAPAAAGSGAPEPELPDLPEPSGDEPRSHEASAASTNFDELIAVPTETAALRLPTRGSAFPLAGIAPLTPEVPEADAPEAETPEVEESASAPGIAPSFGVAPLPRDASVSESATVANDAVLDAPTEAFTPSAVVSAADEPTEVLTPSAVVPSADEPTESVAENWDQTHLRAEPITVIRPDDAPPLPHRTELRAAAAAAEAERLAQRAAADAAEAEDRATVAVESEPVHSADAPAPEIPASNDFHDTNASALPIIRTASSPRPLVEPHAEQPIEADLDDEPAFSVGDATPSVVLPVPGTHRESEPIANPAGEESAPAAFNWGLTPNDQLDPSIHADERLAAASAAPATPAVPAVPAVQPDVPVLPPVVADIVDPGADAVRTTSEAERLTPEIAQSTAETEQSIPETEQSARETAQYTPESEQSARETEQSAPETVRPAPAVSPDPESAPTVTPAVAPALSGFWSVAGPAPVPAAPVATQPEPETSIFVTPTPAASEPEPVASEVLEPAAAESAAPVFAPVPAPSEPAPSEPAPGEPASSELASSELASSEPASSEPASSEPAPGAPAAPIQVAAQVAEGSAQPADPSASAHSGEASVRDLVASVRDRRGNHAPEIPLDLPAEPIAAASAPSAEDTHTAPIDQALLAELIRDQEPAAGVDATVAGTIVPPMTGSIELPPLTSEIPLPSAAVTLTPDPETTLFPVPVPTEAASTSAPTTAPSTSAPTTVPSTSAPTTVPSTSAPTTVPSTSAPAAAPSTSALAPAASTPAPPAPPRPGKPGGGTSGGRGSGRRVGLLVGIGIGFLALLGVLFFLSNTIAGGFGLPTSASSSAAPSPTATQETPAATAPHAWNTLTGGECIAPFTDAWATEFTVVDCAQPHAAQLLAPVAIAAESDAPFPGEASIVAGSALACSAPERIAVGEYTDLQVQAAFPITEQQWNDGQRSYLCFVTRSGGEPLTTSVLPG